MHPGHHAPYVFIVAMLAALGAFLLPGEAVAQVGSADVSNRRAQLEQNLSALEREIDAQRALLAGKQSERVSLERDVAILNAQIKEAQLSIRARDLSIQRLTDDIHGKERTIGNLNDKIVREKQSLGQIIRKTNQIDEYSTIEVVLGNENLSDLFSDIDTFDTLKGALQDSFVVIEGTKEATEAEKQTLEEKQAEELELRQLQVLQRKKIEAQEAERKRILAVTKGVEASYQKLIQEKERSAAQIRAELFTLRGTAAIPFGKALDYANAASAKTGVRPAFILGVIAEESNLGENVGKGNWRVDMHPTRDQPIFKEITAKLGLDPDMMPVSKKAWYGYGGAMGPAQFIPSTWVLYEDRIAKLTGQNPPNPWDPRTAFMASALLLKDNGAAKGTAAAERLAALRYLAGWKNAEKREYAFYGNEVMELAAKYQGLIDILKSS